MVAVTHLLVLACAWTAAVAIPALREACTPKHTGQLVGEPIQLQKTTLQEGIRQWRVLIPDIPQCPNGPVGVEALVCDYDVAPDAYFESSNIIVVTRKGGLLYPGSVTPRVYCGNPQHQNNQLYLSNNLPWQTNQNVAHLYDQSPLSLSSSLPSLTLASQSLLGQLPNNLLSLPQSLWGQSSIPSLSVIPLSHGQSSLGLTSQSLLDLSHNPLLGLSQESVLPSLNVVPLSLDQSHNLLLGQSPLQLLNLGQSPQLLSSQSSVPLLGQASQQVLGQSPLLLGHSSLPLLGNSPQNWLAAL